MLSRCLALLAASAFAAGSHSRAAEMTATSQNGQWTNYSGTDDKGSPVCALEAHDPDKRIGIKYYVKSRIMQFLIEKKSWDIPRGTVVFLSVSFNGGQPWELAANGFQDTIAAGIPDSSGGLFLEKFRTALTATITFKDGDEGAWSFPMDRSADAIVDLSHCAVKADEPAQVAPRTQPFTRPPPRSAFGF